MKARLLIYFLLFQGIALGQSLFKFEHLTVNEGLSHSDAMAVVQDDEGFIWVGTNKGLDRYDGYTLKNYRLPYRNVNGQYTNRVLGLHLSSDKTLWVVAETQGIFFYDPKVDDFKNLADFARDKKEEETLRQIVARSLTTTADGTIYVGTSTQGLYIIKRDQSQKITSLKNIAFPYLGTNALIFALAPDANQRVWVGTVGAGLYYLDEKENPRPYLPWKEAKIIRAILLSQDKQLWVASEEEVIKINSLDSYQKLDQHFNYITSLLEDSYHRLWIGSRTGLFLLSDLKTEGFKIQGKLQHFTPGDPEGLNYHLIHYLVEDSFKNLWIAASAGGLNKVNLIPKPFYKLTKKKGGLPNDYTNTLCQDKEDNVLWIGTRSGFARYDVQTGQIKTFLDQTNLKDAPAVDVTSIYDPGRGTLWIATRVHGIYLLNKKTLSLRRLPEIPGQKEWKQSEPISMATDPEGRIWVACFYDGLHLFSPEGQILKSFSKAAGTFPSSKLTFLLPDQDGMYLSTRDHGLVLLDFKDARIKTRYAFHPKGLKTDYIWPLLRSKKGDLWIGTIGGGLHRLDPKTKQIERLEEIIPEADVESLQEDEQGNIWIGGNGLYRFDPKTRTYLHFDVADGLQSNSFKVASAAKGKDGRLYFGGIQGVSYFIPENVSTNPHPPKMQITQVRILNYAYSPDQKNNPRALLSGPFTEEIVIKNFENDFSIEFVGLNYSNPGKQHYEYMLEGFHKNWIALPPGQRVMGFSNLPAGSYTFLVKADNGDGVWTDAPARLKLRILPPWYRTWWAYLIYGILASSLLLWYKIVSRRQRELKNKIALEQVAKEKEKELAELKVNFFTNVSHELRTPLTLIMSPAEYLMKNAPTGTEAREKAELLYKQANKLLVLVNQLMNFRKVESGHVELALQTLDLLPLITEVYLLFKIKADEQNIHYDLNLPSTPVYIDFDPEKMEIVLSNLLSNAFKFTAEGGKIEVSGQIDQEQSTFQLSISDNGIGIHEEEVEHIFEPFYQAYKQNTVKTTGTGIGLSLVHEFVKRQGGHIMVKSSLGQGTRFTIDLPLSLQTPSIEKESSPAISSPILEPDVNLDQKLLIVEDNEDLRNYLVSLFHSHFETHSAANGKEGMDKALQILPDIILSDVMMPVMNGLEFCERIKNNPKTAHIPLILLTARAATLHELEGLESGADDYIVKPFNPKVLHTKILSLISNRKKAQEFFHKQLIASPSETVIPDADRIFLQTAMQIIEENLTNEQFNVQSLVRESGMSQSAFYRRLKNLTGQSVIEFIKDVRLKRAAQLLSTKQYRVSEVAMMVGMEDLKNFRSSFQKLYGVTPSEFGKNIESKM
jgi:signal transduction histidine kinase/ligand-binding sensor domain-containing protein/DNA-binding response OmpR family regulator